MEIYSTMKHIQLYEAFQDKIIDPTTRKISGRISEISLGPEYVTCGQPEHEFFLSGPTENEEAARVIADDLRYKVCHESKAWDRFVERFGYDRKKRHEWIEDGLRISQWVELDNLEKMGYTLSVRPLEYKNRFNRKEVRRLRVH